MKLEPDALTSQQQDFLRSFIERYTARSKKSRELVQKYRPFFSDWINSLGFRLTLKEIMYPVVGPRSQGSKFWDIDGNEYIDIAIGYGVSFFGNRPPFIVKAIEEQLREGFELGPQSQLAGEVAELICELTGVDRVAFCNTGSEAVMFALRIARAFTGRDKIALFSGAYHGNSDGVLAAPGEHGTMPAAPGTTQGAVKDVLILNQLFCDQCDEHLCIDVCPTGAISLKNCQVRIDRNLCDGCGKCARVCNKIFLTPEEHFALMCIQCGACVKTCPENALEIKEKECLK